MNNDLNIDVKTLRPFRRFIYTIGELPTSYLMSMTYEEQLIWLCNYITQTVIPTINNNGEAVKELQDKFIELKNYIDEYFENLDVQDEINNKLDAMVLDGTLENIISEYIELQTTYAYDNVASMKLATNLVDGSFARTSGYYTYNDGGGAFYKIRQVTNEDVVDEKFIIALYDNTLIAELIYGTTINILNLGAKADDTTDIATYLQSAIDKLFSTGGDIYIPYGIYKLKTPITFTPNNFDNIRIYGQDTTIHVDIDTANAYAFNCVATSSDYIKVTFEKLLIYNESDDELNISCFNISKVTQRELFNNVLINGFYNNINIQNSWNLLFTRLTSTASKNCGFYCNGVTNAFNYNSCIFSNNENYNVYINGSSHTFNTCDLSIYHATASNQFRGIKGLNLISCFYEDSNNPTQSFIINSCEGSITGCNFEFTSTAQDYVGLELYQSNCLLSGNNFNGYDDSVQDDSAYIIKITNGSFITEQSNRFYKLKKVNYVHNSRLHVSNNVIESITCFITQNNHKYANISGDMESDRFANCDLPYKSVVYINLIDIINYGATTSTPNGYYPGQQYFDTTTNTLKIYNGSNWV